MLKQVYANIGSLLWAPSTAAEEEDMNSTGHSNGSTTADSNLAKLRTLMKNSGVDALIVPSQDPHLSEFPASCFKRMEFISKFTGSEGTLVITQSNALLWTDGRYFLQAQQELGPQWTLMKQGVEGTPEVPDWLCKNTPGDGVIGIDPSVHTIASVKSLKEKLEDYGKELKALTGPNLVDEVWGKDRPSPPFSLVRPHPQEWVGEAVDSKLARVRAVVKAEGVDILMISALDQAAWLTNLRGADIAYNPVFLSYMLLAQDSATLYVDPAKVGPEICDTLDGQGIKIKPYESVFEDLKAAGAAGQRVWIDPSYSSYALYDAVMQGAAQKALTIPKTSSPGKQQERKAGKPVFERPNPVETMKAIKNAAELAGMREAHLRDAAALCSFLAWMESQMDSGALISEVEVDKKVTSMRAAQPGFVDLSFETIAGADANGAIIHYTAKPETCATVSGSSMLLLDSGAQYDCGTTDVTRTMHFGQPTPYQKRCFTRVLQGHIAMDSVVFPPGTAGIFIDGLARVPLWREGLNYLHGTGHGVGAALFVHEGPIYVGTRRVVTAPLAAGQVISNEPGYYEAGQFGVRIESVVIVKEVETPFKFGDASYLGFEVITLVPIQLKLVDTELLSKHEVEWLDRYHARVWEEVSPRLAHDPEASKWLYENTRPVGYEPQV